MNDFDFVDVEGDMEGELGTKILQTKKKDVLEEGSNQYGLHSI